jgi:hypothetical protein
MESFVTEEHYEKMNPTDGAFDDTLFIHPDEELLAYGKKLACKQNTKNTKRINAATFPKPTINWKFSRYGW